jgi:Tol biopolymer transport system component
MQFSLSPRSMRGRTHSLGAALLVAALLPGCRDTTSANLQGDDIGTIADASSDVVAVTDATLQRTRGRIVFVRDGNLYIMNANGAGATQLTTSYGIQSPVLSPSGTQIAFVRIAGGASDIYVMNVDGTGLTPLTQNTGYNTSPAWSPTGTQMVFASNRDGDGDIYVMNADGTGVTPLTSNSVYDAEPAWSPDGTRIAFATETISASNREIFVIDANGSNPVRLTTNFLWDQKPAWSPDGSRIAFTCDQVVSQSPFQSSAEICVMNADGTGVIAVTNAPTAFDSGPSWSPDGTRIAFSSNRDGDYDVYTLRSDGGRVSVLTRNSASDVDPSWGR